MNLQGGGIGQIARDIPRTGGVEPDNLEVYSDTIVYSPHRRG